MDCAEALRGVLREMDGYVPSVPVRREHFVSWRSRLREVIEHMDREQRQEAEAEGQANVEAPAAPDPEKVVPISATLYPAKGARK